jgi:hypothetical protein
MNIENHLRSTADRFDDRHAKGNGGDKDAVHDVNVKIRRAAFFDSLDLFSEIPEVRGEHRGCENQLRFHVFFSFVFAYFLFPDMPPAGTAAVCQ